MKTRKTYTKEFKQDAVRLVTEQGYNRSEAARNLGIDRGMLGRWIRELEEDGSEAFRGNGKLTAEQEELRRLREENRRLKLEREVLKNVWSAPDAQAERSHGINAFASMYPACQRSSLSPGLDGIRAHRSS